MSKRFLCMLCALLVFLLVVGCEEEQSQEEAQDIADAAAIDIVADVVVSPDGVSDNDVVDIVVSDTADDIKGEDAVVEDVITDTIEDVGGDVGTDTGPIGTNGTIKAKLKYVKNFPNQVVSLLRSYLPGDKIFKGDLYIQMAKDEQFKEVVETRLILSDYLFSTGFYKDVEIKNLPEGNYWVRFFVDTVYSKEYDGAYSKTKSVGPMDVLLCADGSNPTEGKNPEPLAIQVNLVANQVVDLGQHDLGTLVFDDPSFSPERENGYLLTASSGDSVYRNQIKMVDLGSYTVSSTITAKLGAVAFKGDLCGFVKGQGDYLFTIGVGENGAYVFVFDLNQKKFVSNNPLLIPHPDYGSGNKLDPEKYPWNCRGVSIAKDNKEYLYLISFKGAGSLTNSAPYPLVVVDATDLPTGGNGSIVEKYDSSVDPFFDTSRIIRGVTTDGSKLYLLEASWSKFVDFNTVYVFDILSDGKVNKIYQFSSGTAEDKCGSTNFWVPAIKVVKWNNENMLLVGNDDNIAIYKTDSSYTQVSEINIEKYGSLITSFAVSPDGKALYAMPNCKSYKDKARIRKGISDQRVDLDRHAIVVVDLTSDPNEPDLLFKDRDFDNDGDNDGGIDLEFLYLKESLLRWCATCTGSVPPTAYTGPEIVVGKESVFLRGTGIQSSELNSAGLGQVSDIGVYTILDGRGVIFRNYQIWLDGPSARWGFDLHPENPTKTFEDDVSTAAFYWLSK